MSVAVSTSLDRPRSSSRTSNSPKQLSGLPLCLSKRKLKQHPTESENHHAVLYLRKLTVTKIAISLLSSWCVTQFEAEVSPETNVTVRVVQSDRTGPGIKMRRWFSTKDPKGRPEMVIEKVRVIDKKRMSAWATGFVKHCTWCKPKRGRTGKT